MNQSMIAGIEYLQKLTAELDFFVQEQKEFWEPTQGLSIQPEAWWQE